MCPPGYPGSADGVARALGRGSPAQRPLTLDNLKGDAGINVKQNEKRKLGWGKYGARISVETKRRKKTLNDALRDDVGAEREPCDPQARPPAAHLPRPHPFDVPYQSVSGFPDLGFGVQGLGFMCF